MRSAIAGVTYLNSGISLAQRMAAAKTGIGNAAVVAAHLRHRQREKTKTCNKASNLRDVKVAPTPIDHCRPQNHKLNAMSTRPLHERPLAFCELLRKRPFTLNWRPCLCETACGRNGYYAPSPAC